MDTTEPTKLQSLPDVIEKIRNQLDSTIKIMKDTGWNAEEISAQTFNDFKLINALNDYIFTKPDVVTSDDVSENIPTVFDKLYICGDLDCFDKKMKKRASAKLYCLVYKEKSSEKLIAYKLKHDDEPLYIFEKIIKRRKSENKPFSDRFDFLLEKIKERLCI